MMMGNVVFTAVLLAAAYTAYRVLARAAEQRRREVYAEFNRRKAQATGEPRDLGRLRQVEDGVYVPEGDDRHSGRF